MASSDNGCLLSVHCVCACVGVDAHTCVSYRPLTFPKEGIPEERDERKCIMHDNTWLSFDPIDC